MSKKEPETVQSVVKETTLDKYTIYHNNWLSIEI